MDDKVKIPFSRKLEIKDFQKYGINLIENITSEYVEKSELTSEIESKYQKRLKLYLK
jgi:hypothetical protein